MMATLESSAQPYPPGPYYGAPPGAGHAATGYPEQPRRHPWEIGLLVLVIASSVLLYLLAFAVVLSGKAGFVWLSILATPVVLYFIRGLGYGQQQANGVKMSPTQFPEGYWLVVEAAQRFGLSQVPERMSSWATARSTPFPAGTAFAATSWSTATCSRSAARPAIPKRWRSSSATRSVTSRRATRPIGAS